MSAIFEAARIYARHFQGLSRVTVQYRPHICPFERLLDFIPLHASILDIGCGSGFFLHLCRTMRSAVFTAGVDISALSIAQAERIAVKNNSVGSSTFKACASPADWPTHDNDAGYNVISMIDVLHHIPRNRQMDFVNAAANRLHPGGILLIKDMLPAPFWAGAMNRMHDLVLARQWINYADLAGMVDTLTKQGFEATHEEKIRMLWYAHTLYVLHKK